MDWILDHLQIIIAIAGAIAYWLNTRKKDQAGEPADYDGDGKPDNLPWSGRSLREQDGTQLADENTRRVQEEIRRKIAERNAGAGRTAPPYESAPPLPTPPSAPAATRRRREEDESPYALEEAARRAEAERETSASLERQRLLADQLAALARQRAEAGVTARAMRESHAAADAATQAGARGVDTNLLHDLRNAYSLRKAIVMREVLGTPAGLR